MGTFHDIVCTKHKETIDAYKGGNRLISLIGDPFQRPYLDILGEVKENIFSKEEFVKKETCMILAFMIKHNGCKLRIFTEYDRLLNAFEWTKEEIDKAIEIDEERIDEYLAKLIKEGHPNKKELEKIKQKDPEKADFMMNKKEYKQIASFDDNL